MTREQIIYGVSTVAIALLIAWGVLVMINNEIRQKELTDKRNSL